MLNLFNYQNKKKRDCPSYLLVGEDAALLWRASSLALAGSSAMHTLPGTPMSRPGQGLADTSWEGQDGQYSRLADHIQPCHVVIVVSFVC